MRWEILKYISLGICISVTETTWLVCKKDLFSLRCFALELLIEQFSQSGSSKDMKRRILKHDSRKSNQNTYLITLSRGRLFEKGSTMGVQSQSRVLSNSWWDGGLFKRGSRGNVISAGDQPDNSQFLSTHNRISIQFTPRHVEEYKNEGLNTFSSTLNRSFPQTYYASTKNPFDKADINFTVSLQYGVNRLIKVSPHGHLS